MEGSNLPKKQGRILNLGPHEQRDEMEEKLQKLENGFALVVNRIGNLQEREAHDQLLQVVADQKMYDVVIGGLLYGVLLDPLNASKYYKAMTLLSNGSWFCALCTMNMVLIEMYPRMHAEPRDQILFFFRESIKVNVPKIDNVLINLIRNANDGGDLKESCKLLTGVVSLMNEHHAWLSGLKPKASLIPVALLTFSRFIYELTMMSQYETLCSQMITLCQWWLKERFTDCAQLGRDLVLLLMHLSKLPQFTAIWRQLLYTPNKLSPDFNGIEELMARPCPYNLLTHHISVTFMRKMEFILKYLPTAQEKHIEWIRLKHLSGADSGSLRAAWIRSAIYMPCNETTQCSAEARAILLATITAQSTSGVEQQWCKLNLLWDWLCYDPSVGGHIWLEPGYNALRHLLHMQPLLANSLLDFLVRMSAELHPPLRARITTSVANALKAISDFNIGSPSTIIDHHMVQKSVREAFRETFKIPARSAVMPAPTAPMPPGENKQTPPIGDGPSQSASGESLSKLPKALQPEITSVESSEEMDGSDEKIGALLAAIKEEFRDGIESLSAASSADNEARCELTNRLMSSLFDNYELLDNEQVELIAECFLTIFRKQLFSRKPLPDDFVPSLEVFDQIFSDPLYVIFRSFCMLSDEDAIRQPMLSLISEMRERCPSVSYLLLFFIFSGRGDQSETDTSAYRDLCRELGKPLMQQLVADLRVCHMDDYMLFGHLVPITFEKFAADAMGSVELMKLLVSCLDGNQVLNLISGYIHENITLFRKDSFPAMLTASLSWEPMAQVIFWQLVHGESVPIDWAVQAIPRLQYAKHPEAVSNIYIMLSRFDREPNMNLLRALLSRSSVDMFTADCLKILIREPESASRVAELLASLMERAIHAGDLTPQSLVGKQKRPNQRSVCLELLFAHLDQFRQSCLSKESNIAEQFLSRRELQSAFDAARKSDKVSTLRIRFSELFAVMEILCDDGAQNPRTSRRRAGKKPIDLSDDEGKTKKKRQKPVVLDSDSD
uniref:SOSS complex subunit A homolog n=2 Tax=Ascaris TaxID=6251 RepID=F1KT10_ASCSU